ncbi:MAG: FHA domain-containing protein, partial [Oscillochloris sp.]|nr:FHA domain-containing protein [Oscillochloris sp.]
MIRCSHCNAQQLNGAIFCSECGASLLGGGPRAETTTSLKRDTDGIPSVIETAPQTVVPAPALPTGAQNISLVVINSGRRINLEAGEELLVGRKDNQRGIFPDIDLGLDGGYDAGVSRRHAIIAPHGQGYILEDLASANGTFVNGCRLSPQSPAPICSGDELKISVPNF